jgi:hypothetical protein
MIRSKIVDNVIPYRKSKRKAASHFLLCYGGKMKYFISMNNGKKRLVANKANYSILANFLFTIINFMPFWFLKILKLGNYVKASLNNEIDEFLKSNNLSLYNWNVLIGAYDNKQKVVIQLWKKDENSIYCKVGDISSYNELLSEIEFIKNETGLYSFFIPQLIGYQVIDSSHFYNILLTKEIRGRKVNPCLTEGIFHIFKEIADSKGIKIINGIPYAFSHGDFTPWNMKKYKNKYFIYDWEHCGFRFYGFDLIYYLYQIERLLHKKTKDKALDIAIKKSHRLDNTIIYNNLNELFWSEFNKDYKGCGEENDQ